jgi:CRISPR-associated endonuclease/helicase Cas3
MENIAHIKDNKIQTLEDHLIGTAELTAKFASEFNNEDWGRIIGLLHDVGKYNPEFQSYIKACNDWDEAESEDQKVKKGPDHSTAGAILSLDKNLKLGKILSYCIAGHHAGIPDWIHEIGIGGDLLSRVSNRELYSNIESLVPVSLKDLKFPNTPPCGRLIKDEHIHLWIRMLFSSLVDADFLDTESFMYPDNSINRVENITITELSDKLMTHLSKFKPDSHVNIIRNNILSECLEKAELKPGIFTLTVPTGGGKTLSSMAFALKHAIKYGKKRIIMAIPYTTIIEQTAQTYRSVFGDESILEHHCNLDPEKETSKSRLASENWDMPIIVTTNVQLFESLFATRTSACRKLHNLSNSVIILDEAQMLPPEYLRPILSVLNGLVELFGVTVVLCSATQPAISGTIKSGIETFRGIEYSTEIISDPVSLANSLKRIVLKIPNIKLDNFDNLVNELASYDQVLCIVNTRKDCRDIHSKMPIGTIHLSAYMCPQERSIVVGEIKKKLAKNEPIRVISTQLVEAGVDIDFPVVYRALTGLDSIAQAAGRCNREGKRIDLGIVQVFEPPKSAPTGLLRKGEDTTRELIYSDEMDFTPASIKKYFEIFYSKVITFDKINFKNRLVVNAKEFEFQFRTFAHEFKLIDDKAQKSIIVWYHDSPNYIHMLRSNGIEKWIMRKLQRYSVSISPKLFEFYRNKNYIEEIDGIWVQSTGGLYIEGLGLITEDVSWDADNYLH